jgi:hypothetical protein
VQAEKTLNGFGDKAHLLEENDEKIAHMKNVAQLIIEFIRERVYDKKHVQTQTTFTNVDFTKPFTTIKELDEKRKMEVKLKNY